MTSFLRCFSKQKKKHNLLSKEEKNIDDKLSNLSRSKLKSIIIALSTHHPILVYVEPTPVPKSTPSQKFFPIPSIEALDDITPAGQDLINDILREKDEKQKEKCNSNKKKSRSAYVI